jgi:mannitol-1-/sugar-/sorbitol-6-phosphatase
MSERGERAVITAPVILQVEGVLFDSDGVLVDSHAQVDVAWRALAGEFDLDFHVLATQLVGVPARSTLSRHLHGERLERAIDRLEELEVETAITTAPVAGAIALLEQLPAERWAIVTSATRRLGVARWNGAALPMPTRSVTFDDVTHGKPHPEPFLAGAERLGVPAARCVVFEDSASGGDAAAAAGAAVVAVGGQPWRFTPVARVTDLSHVSVVEATDRHVTLALTSVAEPPIG